jgi:hypothetical protein
MHAKLLNVFVLAAAWGMVGCKTPIARESTDGSLAPATGGTSLAAATGGSDQAATGGSWGSGGSAGEGNATTTWPSTQGTGGNGTGGSTHVSNGSAQGTGGRGTGGSTHVSTGGGQGTGGSGTGGSTGAATGGILGTGGSTAARNPLLLVPLDNEVPGWVVDRESARDPNQRAMTATNLTEATNLIDGAAEPYYVGPNIPKMFLWQNYLNPTLSAPEGSRVSLYIFVMPTAAQAKGLYTALLQFSEYRRRTGTPDDWQPTVPVIGTESRMEDTGTQWWINFYKDVYYVEILLDPSYGPPPEYLIGDPAAQQAALRFAQAIAARI